jgi:hypothetical protein
MEEVPTLKVDEGHEIALTEEPGWAKSQFGVRCQLIFHPDLEKWSVFCPGNFAAFNRGPEFRTYETAAWYVTVFMHGEKTGPVEPEVGPNPMTLGLQEGSNGGLLGFGVVGRFKQARSTRSKPIITAIQSTFGTVVTEPPEDVTTNGEQVSNGGLEDVTEPPADKEIVTEEIGTYRTKDGCVYTIFSQTAIVSGKTMTIYTANPPKDLGRFPGVKYNYDRLQDAIFFVKNKAPCPKWYRDAVERQEGGGLFGGG